MIRECGARTRVSVMSLPCKRIAMANGRCHLHGGKSTGAKTKAGRLRQKMASWKHGRRSQEAIERMRFLRKLLDSGQKMLQEWSNF
jgi:hypothetical protein